VLKDHRFGDPRGRRNLPRGGAAKPAFSEDPKPGIEELLTALGHRQPLGTDGVTAGC
jgi:hypothetical protein